MEGKDIRGSAGSGKKALENVMGKGKCAACLENMI